MPNTTRVHVSELCFLKAQVGFQADMKL